ncbi:unnamed protein product [Amoebophrya sp. A25]|nr:unnamed protein product [Amoebophrya sp. A25]|eukprot:GSA25T00019780001.1
MASQDVVMEKADPPLPENYHKEDTLFIFDWDDTILPTTWLALNDLRVDMQGEIPVNLKNQLDDYAPWAMRTLEEAKKYGKVLIVTNAEDGWIELTIKKFFPSWEKLIDTIPYHSARSTWEPTGCSLPVEWKVRSFDHEIRTYYEQRGDGGRRNIIGLGDSTSDREAMLHVTGSKINTVGKSLKFMERPNLEHLQKQHHLIASSIRQIALHEKSLDLCIQHQMSSDSGQSATTAAGGGTAATGGMPQGPPVHAGAGAGGSGNNPGGAQGMSQNMGPGAATGVPNSAVPAAAGPGMMSSTESSNSPTKNAGGAGSGGQ